MLAQLITEKAGLTTAGNRWKARLLAAPIWGSSGYYSTEVVARDGARAFPVGTPIFWDTAAYAGASAATFIDFSTICVRVWSRPPVSEIA